MNEWDCKSERRWWSILLWITLFALLQIPVTHPVIRCVVHLYSTIFEIPQEIFLVC